MDNGFELLQAEQAQFFLKRFPREIQRQGEICLRKGCVERLDPEEPGVSYRALVRDQEEHQVYLSYKPERGWSGDCTCSLEFSCQHAFAAMSALLEEHRTAVVRKLSAGWQTMRASASSPSAKIDLRESNDLCKRLMDATGRPLSKEETKFLKK